MIRQQHIALIEDIAKQENAFDKLEKALGDISKDTLSIALLNCGIIPEQYRHDSSEEKLWVVYRNRWSYHLLIAQR